jgi:hypothetical protein
LMPCVRASRLSIPTISSIQERFFPQSSRAVHAILLNATMEEDIRVSRALPKIAGS